MIKKFKTTFLICLCYCKLRARLLPTPLIIIHFVWLSKLNGTAKYTKILVLSTLICSAPPSPVEKVN